MSALSFLCGYGYGSNSDDDSDCEIVPREFKRVKLPTPDLSKVAVIPATEEHLDDPSQHGGRIRSFRHERGNWATFVYVEYSKEDGLLDLVNKLQSPISEFQGEPCNQCEDFHISLSKTVVLKYHQISSISNSLQQALSDTKRIELTFDALKIYCNEEKSRTFMALKLDTSSNSSIHEITAKVDSVLQEYNLPTFYEDPSCHMSILWMNGDRKKELETILENVDKTVAEDIGKLSLVVNQVKCKSGNKIFQFHLQ